MDINTVCQNEHPIKVKLTDEGGPVLYEHPIKVKIEGGGGGGDITVDEELSPTSTNPVQNKAIYAVIGNLEAILAEING